MLAAGPTGQLVQLAALAWGQLLTSSAGPLVWSALPALQADGPDQQAWDITRGTELRANVGALT